MFLLLAFEKAYAACLKRSNLMASFPILNHNVTSVPSKSDAYVNKTLKQKLVYF